MKRKNGSGRVDPSFDKKSIVIAEAGGVLAAKLPRGMRWLIVALDPKSDALGVFGDMDSDDMVLVLQETARRIKRTLETSP